MSDLEKHALDGHGKGMTWDAWWERHGADVRAAEPNPERFKELVRRLSYLLTCGESSGEYAVGDPDAMMPWEIDDAADKPSDTTTSARLQLSLPFGREAVTP